jgi:hypothetical protein
MKKTILSIIVLAVTASAVLADVSPTPAPSPNNSTIENVCSGKWVSDKLQAALADMLTKTTQVAGEAKDWTVKQLPDVIHQLLMWKMATSIIECVLPMLLFVVFLSFTIKMVKKTDWGARDLDPLGILAMAGGFASVISFLAIFFCFNLTWLQIWVAPKIFLIEYAKSMVGH